MKVRDISTFAPFVFLILFSSSLMGQKFDNPASYNDFIVKEQSKILQFNINYVMESVHNENYEHVEKQRTKLIQEIEITLDKIKALPPYNDNSTFRDEAVKVFSSYLDAFNIEFKEANLLKAKRKESYQAMEDYYGAQEKAEKKLELAADRLNQAQKKFAADNKMMIVESENKSQQNVIKTINEVNNYSRAVFLTYFRISKLDAEVLDAMSQKDPNKMDESRKKLLIAVDEGLEKLDALGSFKKDDNFRLSAIDLLKFHKELGKEGYRDLIKFLKKESSELTQEDVNMYNSVIEVLNTTPAVLITKFNEMNGEFLKKHIPGGGIRT